MSYSSYGRLQENRMRIREGGGGKEGDRERKKERGEREERGDKERGERGERGKREIERDREQLLDTQSLPNDYD